MTRRIEVDRGTRSSAARHLSGRLLRAPRFLLGAPLCAIILCVVLGPLRAEAGPFEERPMRMSPAVRQGAPADHPMNGSGPFASSGVKLVQGCRVIDWQGEFDGASLQSFKQCVIELNNAERKRAIDNIQDVRMAKLSVDRAITSLGKDKAAPKSTRRDLLRYRDQVGKLEAELEGALRGEYPRRLLMMNSPGGYVLTLTGLLPYLRKDVDIYGGQMIASAGGVAFVSGKGKRIMPESGGQMGIHSVQSGAMGGVTEMAFALKEMKKTNRFLEQQYVRGSKGKLSPTQFRGWIVESGQSPAGMKWLTGRQAMQYGLCDALCRNPSQLIDSYRPQEIEPFLGEVKMFFEASGLTAMWNAPQPRREPHHDPHNPPTTQAPAQVLR